jgi:hypothetical protein
VHRRAKLSLAYRKKNPDPHDGRDKDTTAKAIVQLPHVRPISALFLLQQARRVRRFSSARGCRLSSRKFSEKSLKYLERLRAQNPAEDDADADTTNLVVDGYSQFQ